MIFADGAGEVVVAADVVSFVRGSKQGLWLPESENAPEDGLKR